MAIMISGIFIGFVLGVLVLLATRQKPAWLGWAVLGVGAIALLASLPILISAITRSTKDLQPVFSIVGGAATMVSGIGALVSKRSRSWQTWLGLALGGVPVLFWIAFAAGEILSPH